VEAVKLSPCARWDATGITVAGNGVSGNAANQLSSPIAIFIHKQTKTLYVVDSFNKRIQKVSLNQSSTMADTMASDIYDPPKLFVDDDSDGPTVYLSLSFFNYVQKWTTGATSGVQVGHECRGCSGVSVDKEKNVYMSETERHRILKWSPITNTTITIAGQTDDKGSTSEYLDSPQGIYVDRTSGTVYIVDAKNNRIQKWPKGAQQGITVAGSSNGTEGTDSTSLWNPYAVFVDEETNIVFVADTDNGRIQLKLFT
jgi:hypothetical protein